MYKFVRNLMVLPFLPEEHIPSTFQDINNKAESARTKDTTVWDIPSWSVFRRAIRTNNDVEGWHRRFNDRATGANKPFNELLELLHDETTNIPIQVRLVSEGKLKRCQRKKARAVQGRLFTLWDKYTTQTITTAELWSNTNTVNNIMNSSALNKYSVLT